MHSYVDEHEHVTRKRFGERLKTRFQSYILQSSFFRIRLTLFTNTTLIAFWLCSKPGGGGELLYEWAGMLVVSLRGVNFRFWSRLGWSGQNSILFSRKGFFKSCTSRNFKKLYMLTSFYLLDSCNQKLLKEIQRITRSSQTM